MFRSVEYLIPTQQIVHRQKFFPDVFMLSHNNLSIDGTLNRKLSINGKFPLHFCLVTAKQLAYKRDFGKQITHAQTFTANAFAGGRCFHSSVQNFLQAMPNHYFHCDCRTNIELNSKTSYPAQTLSWHNRVNARKFVQTKTFTNEKVQKFKGVENFHAGYMDFMSGDLLHMYTGKFNGGKCKT